jgi:phosphatidylglycerol:prolipoprotein diacylglycerol transferase
LYLQSPGPIIFTFGPFTLRWYGLLIAIGFLCALKCALRLAEKLNLDKETLVNLALFCFISGVIGARLYYVALNPAAYLASPLSILAIWHGGLSIHGGIIGGIIAGIAYLRSQKLPVLPYADVITACLPLAQAIGRFGNFFNSEAFGLPVSNDFPLKLYIPPQYRPFAFHGSNYFHPTFLYESIWNFLLFLLLYKLARGKLAKIPGMIFCLYLIGYSIGRVIIEPLRVDTIAYFMHIPVPVLASALTVGVALSLLLHFLQKHEKAIALKESEATKQENN